ncbi:SsgA family sporulation/cell division regulator [Streptomyces sp. NPDC058955]|uniref:SsgA family sporulation/cell division regulator n=1 Tax=unclassified Streptomyces TaxID=2593676 RepID=UPI0036503D11
MRQVTERFVQATVRTAHHPWSPVLVRWRCATADPLAVRMDFLFSGGGHPDVTWVFAADLLWRGLARPAGFGSVRIRPHSTAETEVELTQDATSCLVRMATRPLRRFAAEAMARGHGCEERLRDELDAFLDRVLGPA